MRRWGMVLVGAGLAIGCGSRVHLGGDDGGTRDAGPLEPCGPMTCAPGQVCCNASCGICTDPGAGCIAIACADECSSNADCGAAEYCVLTSCSGPGVCVPRPDACPGDFAPVCGCNGTTYSNSCGAASAGASVARNGACDSHCEADDASGQGDCAAIVGTRWDGQRCVLIGGCSCVGSDCMSLRPDAVSCEQAHAGCADCMAMDAHGEGPCDAEIGVIWNGTACVTESGCGCAGTDCAGLYPSSETCQIAHAHCTMAPPCTSDADCPSGQHCYFAAGDCGTGIIAPMGECRAIASDPAVCTPGQPPVCGCDGRTYTCETEAVTAGVSIAHPGACETCAAGTACRLAGTAEGVCREGTCVPVGCGNGVRERAGTAPEFCDDGANGNPSDGCDDLCTRPCGPGIPTCDNADPCDGVESCSSETCTTTAGLPNGTVCTTTALSGICLDQQCVIAP